MDTLICLTCGAMFNKARIKHNIYHTDHYSCPHLKDCGNSLIEVDEGLADVVLKLNRVGARTLYSCFGHLPKRRSSPYIIFYKTRDFEQLKKLRELFIELIDKGKYNFSVGEIESIQNIDLPGTHGVKDNIIKFLVSCNKWKDDILERIDEQRNFLKLLYSVVDELE